MGCENPRCHEIIKQYLICEYADKCGNQCVKEYLDDNKIFKEIIDNAIEELCPNVSINVILYYILMKA